MIKSMTGFGRYEYVDNGIRFNVEIKSVNHRYLELNIKLPKKLNFFEPEIRNYIKKYASRGKIDMFITYEDMNGGTEEVGYNDELARQYISRFKEIGEKYAIKNDVTTTTLLRCQDVFVMEDKKLDEEQLWNGLRPAIDGAAERFVDTRITEGENLREDLLSKLDSMNKMVEYIESRAPEIVAEYRKKIEDKVSELLENAQIDQSRIAAETVIFADKICVDEETVRLKSHISTMADSLKNGGVVGRKLDFIAQEMNREANTILSKTTDLDITNHAIDLKTEIEKVREQIQNIE